MPKVVLTEAARRARVLTAEEMRDMPAGHGWMEWSRDPGEEDVPLSEMLMEAVWLRGVYMGQDCLGNWTTGALNMDTYGRDWRMWDAEPAEDEAGSETWEP